MHTLAMCYSYIHMSRGVDSATYTPELMGSGVYVAESTPLDIDSFYFVDYDICIPVLHGAVRP